MSPRDLEQRIAAGRTTAQQLLADLQQLASGLAPVGVYGRVRGELEEAIDQIVCALDYLTPRADDNYPEDCAHRALQRLAQRRTRDAQS